VCCARAYMTLCSNNN